MDAIDLAFWRRMADRVQALAVHQEFGSDDLDDAEASVVHGRYDWRAYLREELALRRPKRQPTGAEA